MAIPWMLALKVIPWGDVIEHAPKVLSAARKLLERQRDTAPTNTPLPADDPSLAPPSLTELNQRLAAALQRLEQQSQAQIQLTQTVAELAEQNARLVSAVELLRLRTRLLLATTLVAMLTLGWLLLR